MVVFFLSFQPFSIRKQLITKWLFEDLHQQNKQVFLI